MRLHDMCNRGCSVAQLFEGRLFTTPDYHRDYVWQEKQCSDLMQDIEELLTTEEHYFGTLVIQPRSSEPFVARDGKLYHFFEVIDGQQRLITLIILLKVLRQCLSGNGENELAVNIKTAFIAVKSRAITDMELYKFTLHYHCQDFFVANILGDDSCHLSEKFVSHIYLTQARSFFDKYFIAKKMQFNADNYTNWLVSIYEKITNKLKVSLYEIEEAADGHHLLELINRRGI